MTTVMTPRHRAASLLISAFRSVGRGGAFSPADELNVAAAVDALIDAAADEMAAATEPRPVQPGEIPTDSTVSIGRLLGIARSLNEQATSRNDGHLNPAYLDGMLRLISEAAAIEPVRAQVSVEPTAGILRKHGLIDGRVSARRLIELAGPLFRLRPDSRRAMVDLICEALLVPADKYGVAVESAILGGLPAHGYLRLPTTERAEPGPVPAPIRKLISLARATQDGQCGNWALGQAALICKITGIDLAHAARIQGLITEAEESARCKLCRKVIRQQDGSGPWADAGAGSYVCPVSSFGHEPDDNAI